MVPFLDNTAVPFLYSTGFLPIVRSGAKIIRKEDWKVNFSTRSIALAYLGHYCPILVS
jgi:hypothetical protein